jgi:hypothetical protein
MRFGALALTLVLAALPGCMSSAPADGCPATNATARIEDVHGNDLEVRLQDGSPAVLHTAEARILERKEDGCFAADRTRLVAGTDIAFHVDAWAESYPVQGWPKEIILA